VTAPVQRANLTKAVLARLTATGFPIGDGALPDANWIGQPAAPGSQFQPFAVVSEMVADRSEGPIGASSGDWRMPYLIEVFGIRRDQTSALADRLRGSLSAMRFTKLQLGVNTYKVQYVRTDTVGAPSRIDVTSPAFWHQQDNITISIGKEIG
jgi:hypothetical protein